MTGYVKEIFTSIQGEGLRVGRPMTFIRFRGCNLSCNYCDTPESQKMQGPFVYQHRVLDNPLAADKLVAMIDEAEVAITGGEPLLQAAFLAALSARLKSLRKTVYLDTNGTLPEALAKVIKHVDWVALDFKIPTATGRPAMWRAAEKCLRIASRKQVFVKMVVNENLLPREMDRVLSVIERVDPGIPLVIQPVYGCDTTDFLRYQKEAGKRLKDVRIIPQVHKYLRLQ